MIRILKNRWDAFWGSGDHSVTVPPMDGALRPNSALDEAATLLLADGIDNLAPHGGRLYFTQGPALLVLDAAGAVPTEIARFASDISALAIAPDGRIAVGLDEGRLLVGASPDKMAQASEQIIPGRPAFVSALTSCENGGFVVCLGSATHRPAQWKRDLMLQQATGSVWRIADGGAAELLADHLAFPNGAAFLADGTLVIVEAWQHRLLRRGSDGSWRPLLSDLPGYPGRLSKAADGTLWLALFAPRSQMIEFVLREKLYRERMIKQVDEEFWVAPTLRAGKSFKEPLQGGGVKHLGIQKPWGPTRSYGLVVKLDQRGLPILSQHSRSDGQLHGITSVVEWNGSVVAASKGNGALISLVDLNGSDRS